MSRQVVGPVPGQTALALEPEGTAQKGHPLLPSRYRLVRHFVGPEWKQAGKKLGMPPGGISCSASGSSCSVGHVQLQVSLY